MNAYTALYTNITQSFGESFDNQGHSENSAGVAIIAFVVVLLLIVIQLVVIQLLWNVVFVPLVSGVRPMKTLLSPLGLIILIALLVPGCSVTVV